MYLLSALSVLIVGLQCINADIQDMYHWKEVQFEKLPLEDDSYIGPYPYHIPTNNDVLGSGYHAKSGLMIVTIGRLREGVPSALNAFCPADYSPGTSPLLWGFPDFKTNTLQASDYDNRARRSYDQLRTKKPSFESYSPPDFRLITVFHAHIDDRCDRVFVVDTGTMKTNDDVTYWVQKPALVVFDLPSNGCTSRNFATLRRVELPESVWNNPAGFDYVTVDYQSKSGCNDLVLYMNNIFDNSIVVYDYAKNNFWRFTNHSSFVPVPSESYILDQYQLNYGVTNVVVGWPDKLGNKIAYFAPGASIAEYATTTKTLKNRRKAAYSYGSEFRIIGYQGCKGSIHRQFFDRSCGVMFFANTASGQVTCWNVGKPFNPNNIGVILHPDPFEMFMEVYVDSEGYLWMHSCSLYQIAGTKDPLDLSAVNSRLRKVKALDAIQGTVCDTHGALPDEIAWEYLEGL